MSTEQKRTVVIPLDYLAGLRAASSEQAEQVPANAEGYRAQVAILDLILADGITVDMDYVKVAGFAQALSQAAEIRLQQEREERWQSAEREQERIYSEAQAADADWTPSGETA